MRHLPVDRRLEGEEPRGNLYMCKEERVRRHQGEEDDVGQYDVPLCERNVLAIYDALASSTLLPPCAGRRGRALRRGSGRLLRWRFGADRTECRRSPPVKGDKGPYH